MARFSKAKKKSIGISPDSLIFRGEKKSDSVLIRLIDYNSEAYKGYNGNDILDFKPFIDTKSTSWLNIDGLHDEALMKKLIKNYNIDPLVISDTLNTDARPKVQEYDNCLYISIKMPFYNEKEKLLTSENIVLLIKDHMLITFQERVGDIFDPVRQRIYNNKNKKRIRNSGVDYLAFALLDIIIDNYLYIISQIGVEIEHLDDELIDNPKDDDLASIKKFKREINYLRKLVKPIRELTVNLAKIDSNFISESVIIFYKELEHNINLANDSLDSYREILSDQLGVFHTNMSNKLNDVLKVLTIISVIFIPITFIAGIYGTNFDNVPELHLKYGYLYMWIVILIVVALMIYIFKKRKWL